MIDLKHRGKTAARGLGTLAALALLVTAWFGAATTVAAQGSDTGDMEISAITCEKASSCYWEIGARFTVTTQAGEYIGSCTLVGDRYAGLEVVGSNHCTVSIPKGTTVVVTEDISTITPGTVPKENPRYFTWPEPQNVPSYVGVLFQNAPQSGDTSAGQTSNVAIATVENGQPATDVCYVLVDFSNEGCDANHDGQVTFQDIPLGTYTVHQTADLGPGRSVEDFAIQVTGNIGPSGWEVFSTTVIDTPATSSTSASSGSVDIALITRDPKTGKLLTGTCYVLVGASNVGCDENGDGQVTFAAIPYGAYTVDQTRAPAGYPTIKDYAINVQPVRGMPGGGPFGVSLGFIVKQAPDQNAPDTRNVSVVLIDMNTHEKVAADVCVQLVGASNVGCDEDLRDGQIDFLDVPAGGPYELRFSNLPAGYEVATVGGPLAVSIDAAPGTPSNRMIFVLLDVPR